MSTDPAHRHRVICRDARIPTGWVVIGHCHSAACSGDGHNAVVIKRPGRREVIAAGSPIPEGWRRVRASRSEACDGEGDNAWLIERTELD